MGLMKFGQFLALAFIGSAISFVAYKLVNPGEPETPKMPPMRSWDETKVNARSPEGAVVSFERSDMEIWESRGYTIIGDYPMIPSMPTGLSDSFPVVDSWWCLMVETPDEGKPAERTARVRCVPQKSECDSLLTEMTSTPGSSIEQPCISVNEVFAFTYETAKGEAFMAKPTRESCEEWRGIIKDLVAFDETIKKISPCESVKRR